MSGRVTSVRDFPTRVLLAAMFWEFPPVRYACVQEIAATPPLESAAQIVYILCFGHYSYFFICQTCLHDLFIYLYDLQLLIKLKIYVICAALLVYYSLPMYRIDRGVSVVRA